eukprot:TRINITY_DN1478_c0_g1_i7.p1 TRINITY_DN1478_c0_g1~~TRINITY_DN1478_c0_g1_i7.p1  ORF type:complete len:119 (+),score=27.56 TRINITY_DN1478_c0_g1_i7:95-451(+)
MSRILEDLKIKQEALPIQVGLAKEQLKEEKRAYEARQLVYQEKKDSSDLRTKELVRAVRQYATCLGLRIELLPNGARFFFSQIDPSDHEREFWIELTNQEGVYEGKFFFGISHVVFSE